MQALIIELAEIQHKFNAQPQWVSEVKKHRALIWKEWKLLYWDGDVWEDPDEAVGVELLDFNEIFCQQEISPPKVVEEFPPSASVCLSLLVCLKKFSVIIDDNAHITYDLPSPPTFVSMTKPGF